MTARRGMEIDDLFRMKIVDDPDVNPSGTHIVFNVTWLDKQANTYRSQLWLHDLDGGQLHPLTAGTSRDTSPRWSPDGKWIAFLSDRGDDDIHGNQIWLLPSGGGEAHSLTNGDHSVETFAWSPHAGQIAYVAAIEDPDEGATSAGTDVMVIRTPRFRFDGSGFLRNRYKQIFITSIGHGQSEQITTGKFNHTQPSWSPTGYEIAFVSNRDEGWEYSNVHDIYIARLPDGWIRKLTDGAGSWSHPSWSPSGRTLAFYGTRRLDSASPRTEIFLSTSTGSDLRSVTAKLDIDFHDASIADWASIHFRPPAWLDESNVAVVASARGAVRLARLDTTSGGLDLLTPETGRAGAVCPLPQGGFVFAANSFTDPGELYRLAPDGEIESITSFNTEWNSELQLSTPEPLSAVSPDGEEISGWLLRPTGPVAESGAPLLLEIHGGPFGMYADTLMHEFHFLSALGYAVVFCNPRGSAGYGDRFADILSPEMGENDLPDLLAIVDAALVKGGFDESRLGVLGGSYGGFMTNWVIAHSDRFKAAVTMRTISDWFSTWGTDDIFVADCNVVFGATPWENPEIYFRLSPLTYVEQMTAPILIIHSEEDYRCPIGQGEQLFTSLKRLGRTTELVRFPDESHGLSRTGQPRHRVERLEHIARWFDTYL